MPLITDRFFLDGREVDFDLHRKKSVRRNILVRFEDNGRMKVSAPMRTSRKSIHLVLSDMHDQIVELRRLVRERNRGAPTVNFRQGARHSYLGRTYPLDIRRHPENQPRVLLRSDRIEIHVRETGEGAVRELLERWYRTQAKDHFSQRAPVIASRARWLRGNAFQLRLRRMKRSWGTCSTTGIITLNPALIKAPPSYIDYVIAHELCHLREHNHSAAFYRLLEKLIPNWAALRNALNERSQLYLK